MTEPILRDPRVEARLHLLATSEGGRKTPILTGLRCPTKLEAPELAESYWDCSIDIDAPLPPGGTADAVIRFLSSDVVIPRLRVGSMVRLWEGRFFGHAVVTAVHTS